MNRKWIVESNEKQKVVIKWEKTIRWRPITYLTRGSLNQGLLCEEDGGSGGAEEYIKGSSDMI